MTNLTSTPGLDAAPAVPSARVRSGRRPEGSPRLNPLGGVAHIALFLWALATAGPLIWVLLASFKNNTEIFLGKPFALPESFSFSTYADAWGQAHIGRYF